MLKATITVTIMARRTRARQAGSVITACHTLIYSDDAEATRAFLRDVLQLPHVDAGGPEPGWLIFRTGPSEVGVHPTSGEHDGQAYSSPRRHGISFLVD